MQEQEKVLIGAVDAAQISQWKVKCPAGIYKIEAGEHVGYFRNPTRHDVAKALSEASDENPLAAIEKFGELTFIGGSEEVLKDDELFLSARFILKDKLMTSKVTAQLVNL